MVSPWTGKIVGVLLILSLLHACSSAGGSSMNNKNPLQQGCLYAKNLTNKIRICNSEDPPSALSEGVCREPPFDYAEVRIQPGDWDSTLMGTWILQILLSEILQVPTSLEMGSSSGGSSSSLYHPNKTMALSYHSNYGNYLEALKNAYKYQGDCSKANKKAAVAADQEDYEPCAHFTPEERTAKSLDIEELVSESVLEQPKSLNMLASQGWFIPRFTAQQDPTLLSYMGMRGESNRQKLAKTFKRPQTWQYYCNYISTNNCTIPDDVAERPPNISSTSEEGEELDRFYVEGLYKGYFLATDKNNCTLNPKTCSGHFIQYPCGWRSNVPTQVHYLNISLDPDTGDGSNGTGVYSFPQMVDIYRAAVANRENVIVLWWSPEGLAAEMMGTDAEFTPVSLPLPTLECINNKAKPGQHCAANSMDRLAPPQAVCGEPARTLHTLMSTTLFTTSQNNNNIQQQQHKKSVMEAVTSPAHAALMKYELTELQLGELFTRWNQLGGDPREAVCDWIEDNLEYLESLIPRSYPRIPVDKDPRTPLMYASTIVGGIALGLVLLTMVLVYENRRKKAIQYAQVEFLGFLLIGSVLIAVGAIIIGSPPSSVSCIVEIWFINVGYTLELVPLVVKVAAVNYITQTGNSMRRAKIKREFLFGAVLMITLLMVLYLSIWTVLDPPKLTQEYELTESVTADEDTVVLVLNVCASESMIWRYLCLGWNGFLLLCTTILAIQMRKVPMEGFCETPTLALLVYSHMMFVLLRVVTYALTSKDISHYTLTRCQSLIFSMDTAATIVIYFLPKFLAKEGSNTHISPSSLSIATYSSARMAPFNKERPSIVPPTQITDQTTTSASTTINTTVVEEMGATATEEQPPMDCTNQRGEKEGFRTSTPGRKHPSGRLRTSTNSWIVRSVLDDNGTSALQDLACSKNDNGEDKFFQHQSEDDKDNEIDPLITMRRQLEQTQQRNEELEKENVELKKQLVGPMYSSS